MLWITGSKGLLGSALTEQCKAVLHLGTGRELDIANLEEVRLFVKAHPEISHIVNCAAFSQVDDAEKFTEEAFRVNAVGPENLAKVANEIGAKLIHISTDYVFAGIGRTPLKENDPTGPCGMYGKSKLVGEEKALQLGACVIRTSWIFGTGGKNFVSKLWNLFQKEKEIRLSCDQWSRFTYAPDLARVILQMLDETGLYQFANVGVATKYDFARQFQEELLAQGQSVVTERILPVSGKIFPGFQIRPVYSAFDTSKIEQKVTIRPWQYALRDFLCVH